MLIFVAALPRCCRYFLRPVLTADAAAARFVRASPSPRVAGHRQPARLCSSAARPRGGRLKPPWRVLFFGTDSFSVAILDALQQSRILPGADAASGGLVDRLEVVVNAAKNPVRSYASSRGIQIHEWPVPPDDTRFDVGVLASFGRLIPERVIRMFPFGILNVHPSILPRWRGATPIPHTILHGDKVSGVSIMEIAPKHFDVGPILLQEKYPLWEGCTTLQLSHFLAIKGSQLLLKALQDLPHMEQAEKEQRSTGVTYAPKIHSGSELFRADIAASSSYEIDRKYRALSELYDLKCSYGPHPVKLRRMLPLTVVSSAVEQTAATESCSPRLLGSVSTEPGTAFYSHQLQAVCIRCQDGWVAFKEVVLRKPLSAHAFANGYLSKKDNESLRFTCLDSEPLLVKVAKNVSGSGCCISNSAAIGSDPQANEAAIDSELRKRLSAAIAVA